MPNAESSQRSAIFAQMPSDTDCSLMCFNERKLQLIQEGVLSQEPCGKPPGMLAQREHAVQATATPMASVDKGAFRSPLYPPLVKDDIHPRDKSRGILS